MLARLFIVPLGLILGCAAALVFLPLAALLDPVTREAGAIVGTFGVFAALATAAGAADPDLAALGAAVSGGLFAVCVVPLVVAALIGEVARVRSLVWYAGATGIIAALVPFILRAGLHTRAAAQSSAAEGRFLLLFFVTGVVGGAIYWLTAGRGAGGYQGRPNVSSNA